MNIIQTVKKSILPSGSTLRMFFSIEGIYYIVLETQRADWQCDSDYFQPPSLIKNLLWNGARVDEANREFENFKNNPLIQGQ